tara:strand:- start:2483 stop:2893 length:411 start_codon:yes stop_codon:yes gene_type:complete
MEILIYISGLLTTLIAALIVVSTKLNRKYGELLESNQSISDTSFIRMAYTEEQLEILQETMKDIQDTMKKDQYESLSGINKELDTTGKLALSNNRKIGENAKVFNKNITDILTEIQQINKRIKIVSQDQTGTSNYT